MHNSARRGMVIIFIELEIHRLALESAAKWCRKQEVAEDRSFEPRLEGLIITSPFQSHRIPFTFKYMEKGFSFFV